MSQKEIHNYDIRIATNGDWYHEGSKINRIELVKLFASVLHKKDDNKYWNKWLWQNWEKYSSSTL